MDDKVTKKETTNWPKIHSIATVKSILKPDGVETEEYDPQISN